MMIFVNDPRRLVLSLMLPKPNMSVCVKKRRSRNKGWWMLMRARTTVKSKQGVETMDSKP